MAVKEFAIVEYIRQSILDTFSVQIGMKAEVPSVNVDEVQSAGSMEGINFLGVLGMKATGYTGSLALGFPKETFFKVMEKLTGETPDEMTGDSADACSELLNIIYASTRTKINEAGFDFQPAIPVSIQGNGLSMVPGNASRFLKFSCQSEAGPFLVVLTLKKSV